LKAVVAIGENPARRCRGKGSGRKGLSKRMGKRKR